MREGVSNPAELEAARKLNDGKAEAIARVKNAETIFADATREARALAKKEGIYDAQGRDYTDPDRVLTQMGNVDVEKIQKDAHKVEAVDILHDAANVENRLWELRDLDGLAIGSEDGSDVSIIGAYNNGTLDAKFGDTGRDGKKWVVKFNGTPLDDYESKELGESLKELIKERDILLNAKSINEKDATNKYNLGEILVKRVNQQTKGRFKL